MSLPASGFFSLSPLSFFSAFAVPSAGSGEPLRSGELPRSGELAGAGVEWVTQKLEAAAAALGKSTGLEQASRRARLEQRVEDYNALQKASGTFHRAVLVLPLTPEFDPPRGQPGHGRVQFSDRVSASASVGKELTRRALEVPFAQRQFVLHHEVHGVVVRPA